MNKPVKVRFRKIPNGKIFLSYGYYLDKADFRSRNSTYVITEWTKITKPIPVKKEKLN